MSKLEEQIDELQDLAERAFGWGAAVSLDPPGTRKSQTRWEGTIWNKEGDVVSLDEARTEGALVITMLATAREEVAKVERSQYEDAHADDVED